MKYIFIGLVLSVAFISIIWQIDYEIAIADIQKDCLHFKHRYRLRYTPVIIYKLKSLLHNVEYLNDRKIYNLALRDCNNIQANGYHIQYLVHSYLTSPEKDSLMRAYNTYYQNPPTPNT